MSVILLLVFMFPTISALNVHHGFPTKCLNFTDTRSSTIVKPDFGRTVLTIPAHLTSNGLKEIRFSLANNFGFSFASLYEVWCDHPEVAEIPLTVDGGQHGISLNKYPFQDQWKFSNDTYFTVDGYLHRESNFLNPDDYCIESISDTRLVIKTCKLNCSADLSKSYLLTRLNENFQQSRICIPKCCGIDETLSLQDNTCRKLDDKEPNYFMPYLHLQEEIWFLKESQMNRANTHKVLVRPVLSRRQTWNSTHGISGGGEIWGLLHFTRNTMNCSKFTHQSIFYNDVKNHGKNAKNRYNFRVEVTPGQVQVSLLTGSRKWMEYKREFCIDGLDEWGKSEGSQAINQVVLFCKDDDDNSTIVRYVDEQNQSKVSPVEYLYTIITLVLAIILLIGCQMFWQIRKKLNFRGNLIRGHLNFIAGLYLYTFVALLVSLINYKDVESNAVTVVTSENREGKRIGWFCVLIGALCHYAYLSTFLWILAMMCYDMGGNSENARKGLSMAIGLGVPLVLMIAFGIADVVYNDPWLDVVVPDYGVESCFIASWSAGFYLHIPVAIIIGILNIYAFVWFIRNLRGNAKFDSETILLFVVVLSALTFGWIIDATKWLRVYSGKPEDNWFQTTLLFIGLIVPAFVLFHVYCMNEVVLGLFGDKMSSAQRLAKILRNKKLVWGGRGLIGQICDQVIDEDTVIIEGETMLRDRTAQ